MKLRYALVTTTLGWILGIGTAVLSQNLRESHERRELASTLLVEVRQQGPQPISGLGAEARPGK